MHAAEIPAEALAVIEIIAGAIRDELGDAIDADPGCRTPEGADPLNRAFRVVVRSVLGMNSSADLDADALVSRALRLVAVQRLASEGWDDRRVKTLVEEEPGSPDDWLAYLILSSRSQIDPLLTPEGPDRA